MKKRLLKRFLIFLISSTFTVLSGVQIVEACADWDYDELWDSFFAPEVINSEKYKPFFKSDYIFYHDQNGYQGLNYKKFDTINVEEWHTFFKQKVNKEDLHYLLYQARLGEIDTLIFYIKDKGYPIKSYLKGNSIAQFEEKAIGKEFLFFLGFAKRCSKVSLNETEWEDEDEEEKANQKLVAGELLKGGTKLIKNVKNEFIRERYFFQLTRLYFFNGSYSECLNYYNQHADSFPSCKSMKYRSMSYAAGAARKLNQVSKANYMYAKVYDQFDLLKETAFQSFGPKEEKDLQASLALAKDARDKMVIWHMVGIKNDPLRAMKEIYKIDMKSDLLEVLVVRAINEMESSALPGGYCSECKIKADLVNKDLLQFIMTVAENTNKPYLWHLSAGYLLSLAGDDKKAEGFITKAKSSTKGDLLAEGQIRIIELVSKVEKYYPTERNETKILAELKWLKDDKAHPADLRTASAYSWTLRRLAEIYDLVGEKNKAYCLNYQLTNDYLKDNIFIDTQIAYITKSSKSPFDQFIIELYPYKKEVLYDMQGVNLLYEYKFKEAREKFLKAGKKPLESNPFTIRVKDCRDCDQSEYAGGYDNLKFIDEMISLEEKAKASPADAYKNYLKLANGYYNMTYFGNCRNMYINQAFDPGLIEFHYGLEERLENKRLLDCSHAEAYYLKAMNVTIDKEQKAKCAFLASKCEQNSFFSTVDLSNDDRSFRAGKYFKMLKEQYSTTNYYKEIIKECGYFKTYVSRKY